MKYLWLLSLLFALYAAVAQDCDQIVYDGAGVLNGQEQQIEQAAQDFINHGVVLRIRTVSSSQNMDVTEKQYEQACPSWRQANGVRNSMLLALMVAPKDRKKGFYYGANWHSLLDANWQEIVADHMVPNFRAGNYAQGFIATLSATDALVHPQPKAPIDLSGLWKVLTWLLFLGGTLTGIVLVASFLARRKNTRDELRRVQLSAIQYKNMAGQMVNRKRVTPLSPSDQGIFDSLVEQYSDASGSEKNNPEGDGQTLEMYRLQESLYRRIYEGLRDVGQIAAPPPVSKDNKYKNEPRHPSKYTPPVTPRHKSNPPPPPVQYSEPERVVVHDNSAGFTEGVLLGSLLDRDRDRDRDDDYRASRRRDEDSGSSSSSSWGSSDSGGGGGSSYDSSSDSGSGGGDSFGGGSDSGGGGGGDF